MTSKPDPTHRMQQSQHALFHSLLLFPANNICNIKSGTQERCVTNIGKDFSVHCPHVHTERHPIFTSYPLQTNWAITFSQSSSSKNYFPCVWRRACRQCRWSKGLIPTRHNPTRLKYRQSGVADMSWGLQAEEGPGHDEKRIKTDEQLEKLHPSFSQAYRFIFKVEDINAQVKCIYKTDTTMLNMPRGWYILVLMQVARSFWNSSNVCQDRSVRTVGCLTWSLRSQQIKICNKNSPTWKNKARKYRQLPLKLTIKRSFSSAACLSLSSTPVMVPQMFW